MIVEVNKATINIEQPTGILMALKSDHVCSIIQKIGYLLSNNHPNNPVGKAHL
jgi:hypothetical protein